MKQLLSECFGLFTKVDVTWREEAELREAYEDAFEKNPTDENLYGVNFTLTTKACGILNKKQAFHGQAVHILQVMCQYMPLG